MSTSNPQILLLLFCSLYIITNSRFCYEVTNDCNKDTTCSNSLSYVETVCGPAAAADSNWICTSQCEQDLATYATIAEPSWFPNPSLNICECDTSTPDNGTSCVSRFSLLSNAGCGDQFATTTIPPTPTVIFTPTNCGPDINPLEPNIIYVSSLGNDSLLTCGSKTCPCGTIGYAYFLATNSGPQSPYGSNQNSNTFFYGSSITIKIDGVNPDNLLDNQNFKKCGIYYNEWGSNRVDPVFGVGSIDHKNNITFDFTYVRDFSGQTFSINHRKDWFPYDTDINDGNNYCDNYWDSIFKFSDNTVDNTVHNSQHQIKIFIKGLKWNNAYQRATLINFDQDSSISVYLEDAYIDSLLIDTNGKNLIVAQTVQIIDSTFQNIFVYNEKSTDIFQKVQNPQWLFGDQFYETTFPKTKWAKGYEFINCYFGNIYKYEGENAVLRAIFDASQIETQNIDADLSIIGLPAATFSTWLKYRIINCEFDTIWNIDVMRSDPGVLMTAPWNITNTRFISIADAIIMDAKTRTDISVKNIYIETSTLRDASERGLFQLEGQTENVFENITYNWIFPIQDLQSAQNPNNIDFDIILMYCLNQNERIVGFQDIGYVNDNIAMTLCQIPYYPIPLLVNSGETIIKDINTLIAWNKQNIIDLFQVQDLSTYPPVLLNILTHIIHDDCIHHLNCTYYPILYDYYDFEWFVGADFDIAMIVNQAGGLLTIDNWYTDRGVNNALLYNTGEVIISNLTTDYYHQFITSDADNVHDPNDLHGDFCFFNSIGSFEIRDSKLFGCGTWTFGILESDVFIVDNVEIRWSVVPFSTANDVDNLQITNSEFIQVGLWYSSLFYIHFAFPLVQTPPFALAGKSTYFENCLFSFYDPIGMIHAPFSLFELDYTQQDDTSYITIKNCEIIINIDYSNNSYPQQGIFNLPWQFKDGALILLDDNTQLTFINNLFE
eukprot:315347_1